MAYPTDPIYKFIKDPISNNNLVVKEYRGGLDGARLEINIPLDNTTTKYYKKYKAWVDAGNTAEAGD